MYVKHQDSVWHMYKPHHVWFVSTLSCLERVTRQKGLCSSNPGSVQFSSVAQLCPILCDPMNHSTPGLSITNSWSSLKLMSIKSVMSFSHLILCRPLLLLPPIPPASESFPMSQGIEPQNLRGLLLQDSPVFFLESNTY